MDRNYREDEDTLIVDAIQSFLQEKRTALKAIRTGIAVILAQISAVGFLAAAFRNHAFIQTMHWMDVLVVLAAILLGTTVYLVVYPIIRIHHLNRKISEFKQRRNEMVNLTHLRIPAGKTFPAR